MSKQHSFRFGILHCYFTPIFCNQTPYLGGFDTNTAGQHSKRNTFVFARAIKGSMDHLRGWDSVSSNVKEIEGSLHQPKSITSTKLQKCHSSLTETK